MPQNAGRISDLWKNEYSKEIRKYSQFTATEQFTHFASLFTPGNSYFYILNMHDLELDYISPTVEKFINCSSEDVTMGDLLKAALPEEIEKIEKKEIVIKDFYGRYLGQEQITSYKLVYSYQMKNPAGEILTILHQATPLSIAENGTPQHILSVHSDISHLRVCSTKYVSLINIKGGESFYNIDPSQGYFDPSLGDTKCEELRGSLTKREKEIICFLAKGYNANEIAEKLMVSSHTIRTHRKNILQKSGCNNTVELVAKCLTGGIVDQQEL